MVRKSFADGLIPASGKCRDGKYDLLVGTRKQVALQAEENGHASVPRASAWDARVPGVDAPVVPEFEAIRRRYGGFPVLIQTPEWEFLTVADDADDRTIVGAVVPPPLARLSTAR
ncbi:MAG: hypothetical protein JSV19_08975 [Phycisphaerales bacterium]|nr:MAG: hypothetical protein JSV19_08975 [Phycisphaerales bacterium]